MFLRKALGAVATEDGDEGPAGAPLPVPGVGECESGFKKKLECVFDDFELGVTLGTGTFGRVRLARFKRAAAVGEVVSSHYALKILRKSEILRLKQLAHIKNETVLLSLVEHPFIVNLVNHFQDECRLIMVLEFVPGGELFTYLRKEGRMGNDEARFFATQIVLVFGYLHSKSIAYRDLKPENLLLDRNGYLKMADFGFAKIVEQRTWTLCGTPEYLAPEIIQSKGHSMPVDWWACGVLIFEMLAGYPPFYDENPFGIYQKILSGTVDYPRHMDAKAVQLMKKLLVADLTKRIGCLKAGVADVQRCKWLQKVDWKQVYNREEKANYVPELQDDNDTGNFDEYPDSPPGSAAPLTSEQAICFTEFDKIGFKAEQQTNLDQLQAAAKAAATQSEATSPKPAAA
jgi:protein kinase X